MMKSRLRLLTGFSGLTRTRNSGVDCARAAWAPKCQPEQLTKAAHDAWAAECGAWSEAEVGSCQRCANDQK